MKEFLSIADIQEAFGVSRATVNKWLKDNEFPNAFKIGGTVRIPVSDIEALKSKGSQHLNNSHKETA